MRGGELIFDLGSVPFSQERFQKVEIRNEKRATNLTNEHSAFIGNRNFNFLAHLNDYAIMFAPLYIALSLPNIKRQKMRQRTPLIHK